MKTILPVFLASLALTTSVPAQDTVHVEAGWNMIGSVKAGAVPDVLFTVPDSLIASSFFGYAPGVGYASTDTLDTGFGYWVKVISDGIIVFTTMPAADSCKSKAFIYQGKFYNTVKIGDRCWMAENLDAGTMVTGVTIQTDNDTTEKYCYDNDPLSCALYGGLFQWNEAMQYVTTEGAQGICPPGWHLPTYGEFQTFAAAAGREGNGLKAVGQGTGDGAGTNTSGFSALLAGDRSFDVGGFDNQGLNAYFWSSTENVGASYLGLFRDNDGLYISLTHNKNSGFSVRCVADQVTGLRAFPGPSP